MAWISRYTMSWHGSVLRIGKKHFYFHVKRINASFERWKAYWKKDLPTISWATSLNTFLKFTMKTESVNKTLNYYLLCTYFHHSTVLIHTDHIVEILIQYIDNHCWHNKGNYCPGHHQDKCTLRLFESKGPTDL